MLAGSCRLIYRYPESCDCLELKELEVLDEEEHIGHLFKRQAFRLLNSIDFLLKDFKVSFLLRNVEEEERRAQVGDNRELVKLLHEKAEVA